MCKLRNCSHKALGLRAPTATTAVATGSAYRLPHNVWPLHYDLELTPDFEHLSFWGTVSIDVDVREAVSAITLNANELTIAKAVAEGADGTVLNGTVTLDHELQRATIDFAGRLGVGVWKLKLTFAGTLNDELKGFYRSTWTDKMGVEHVIATTQFEATDARRAFPCFDEPEMKATFQVTMNVPSTYTALSTTPAESVATFSVEPPAELMDNSHGLAGKFSAPELLKVVRFARTPKMSTYFLAFVAGELEWGGTVNVNGKELRFWSTPGKSHQLKFAQQIAAFSLDTYEKYFGIPYHGGNKIDFLAVPDFAAGAMENLGLIIYRETDLLADEATATQGELERVAHVVAHELAHMWFGDYATMKWWNGLWLNESFATYMENKVVDMWKPEWHTWDSFASSRASAFGLDQLHSTHAIEVPVENPFQIDEIFDLISYEKGCSVLRMLEQYIGDAAFRRGVQIYLNKHALSNTETHDLWNALEAGCHEMAVDVPVRRLMDAWVFTSGHPVVQVSESSLPGFIELAQSEFKVLRENTSSASEGPVWPIPVVLRSKGRDGIKEQKFIFDQRKQTVYVGEGAEWVVINAGGNGFFRVIYAPALLKGILANKKTIMTDTERYNLLNDSWACVRARLVGLSDYLKLVDQFTDETDPQIWGRIIGAFNYLHGVVSGPVRAAVEGRVRTLLKPHLARLGYAAANGDSVKVKDLRTTVVSALGNTGKDAAVIAKAREMFAAWKKNPTSVDSDVFATMVYVLAGNGDADLYKEFDSLRASASTPQDRERFMYALTSFKAPELIDLSLNLVLSGGLRVQNAPYFLSSLLDNEAGSARVWESIKSNWGKINEMWPAYSVADLFDSLASLDTAEQEADVIAFFKTHTVDGGQMQLAQGLEKLRINVLLRQTVDDKVIAHVLPVEQETCMSPEPVITATGDITAAPSKDTAVKGADASSSAPEAPSNPAPTAGGTVSPDRAPAPAEDVAEGKK